MEDHSEMSGLKPSLGRNEPLARQWAVGIMSKSVHGPIYFKRKCAEVLKPFFARKVPKLLLLPL